MAQPTFLKSYSSSINLIIAIAIGSLVGLVMKANAAVLKPLGDIFLNLLFTVAVPLVFFSIASTMAQMTDLKRLGRIIAWMFVVFVATGLMAAVLMLVGVTLFPPAQGVYIPMGQPVNMEKIAIGQQLVRTVSVGDFTELFSRKNMLALILFSLLLGSATAAVGGRGKAFADFLAAGNAVMMKAIAYVMMYAPIGLGAYFAYLVGTFGSAMFGTYCRAIALYYPVALLYFFVGFSFYAWLAGGMAGIKVLWSSIVPAALTAWGTGSGLATLPVNLEAAKKIGIPDDIRDVVVNIGASVHSDGSCLAAVIKIALLFGIFKMPMTDPLTIASIIAVALLCGTVISGIPSGGMLGELLIVTLFGFPIEAMPIITMLGTLVDPPATMVNVVGDNACGMLVARLMNGPKWMAHSSA